MSFGKPSRPLCPSGSGFMGVSGRAGCDSQRSSSSCFSSSASFLPPGKFSTGGFGGILPQKVDSAPLRLSFWAAPVPGVQGGHHWGSARLKGAPCSVLLLFPLFSPFPPSFPFPLILLYFLSLFKYFSFFLLFLFFLPSFFSLFLLFHLYSLFSLLFPLIFPLCPLFSLFSLFPLFPFPPPFFLFFKFLKTCTTPIPFFSPSNPTFPLSPWILTRGRWALHHLHHWKEPIKSGLMDGKHSPSAPSSKWEGKKGKNIIFKY